MKKFFILIVLFSLSCLCYAQTVQLMVKKGEKGLYIEHSVAPKEGLYYIGRLYNINARTIASYNHIDLNKGLEINQVINVPLNDTNFTQKNTSGTPVYHHVVSGDGLYKISSDNNKLAMKSLRDWNSLTSDNIKEGSDLIIGFLVSKEMVSYLANNRVKKQEADKQAAAEQAKADELAKQAVPVQTEEKAVTKTEPAEDKKTVVKEDKPIVKADPPATTKPVVMDATPALVKEEVKEKETATIDDGYFKASFDQQVKAKPASKSSTVTSGIFKTTSGWVDAKYYLLMDGVTPGTIIKVINPDNNRAVYAKVLGEMNGIRQNQGLDIRISSAAASALAIKEDDKFVVKVNY